MLKIKENQHYPVLIPGDHGDKWRNSWHAVVVARIMVGVLVLLMLVLVK